MSCSAVPWHTSFIGQNQQHTYWLYAIIDRVMREVKCINSILELGTGAGALSCVFGLWGIEKQIPVHTIDKVNRHNSRLLTKLDVSYHQQDIFCIETEALIAQLSERGPMWLFCDGGSKQKELQHFSHMLPAGSIVSAHDLGVEFQHQRDASILCNSNIIEPFHTEWWMEGNAQIALYRKL
jgi:hypothetical protein